MTILKFTNRLLIDLESISAIEIDSNRIYFSLKNQKEIVIEKINNPIEYENVIKYLELADSITEFI
jgi:hypothetical protein